MREIEFRGKRKDTGEWVYGRGIFVDNATPGDPVHVYSDGYFRWREIIPETVGQYTGLKDKNGVKIFEGDIVRIRSPRWHDDFIMKVAFNNYCAFELSSLQGTTTMKNSAEMEVIGNIHDNPELLEA